RREIYVARSPSFAGSTTHERSVSRPPRAPRARRSPSKIALKSSSARNGAHPISATRSPNSPRSRVYGAKALLIANELAAVARRVHEIAGGPRLAIAEFESAVSRASASPSRAAIDRYVRANAAAQNVDPALIAAVIASE